VEKPVKIFVLLKTG